MTPTPLVDATVPTIAAEVPLSCSDAVEGARRRVTSYVDGLFAGLELPLGSEAELSVGGVDHLRLTVGGRSVRLPAPAGDDADAVVQAVTRAVHACRELAVTDQVATAVWRAWFDSEPGSVEAFRWLLAEAVRYGFRIGRLRRSCEAFARDGLTRQTAETVFEESVGEPGTASLRLLLGGIAPAEAGVLSTLLGKGSEELFWELGLIHPEAAIEVEGDLEPGWFRVEWNDLQGPPRKGLGQDRFRVNDTVERLRLLGVEGEPATDPGDGTECALVRGDDARELCERAGLTVSSPEDHLVQSVAAELRRNAGAFLSTGVVDLYDVQLRQAFPRLVDEARRRFEAVTLTRTLRLLLDEEISVRDLRSILEGILSVDGTTDVDHSKYIVFNPNTGLQLPVRDGRGLDDLRAEDFAEAARTVLRRYISHKYTRGQNTLIVYLMDPDLEARLGDPGPLAPQEHRDLLDAVRLEVGSLPPTAQHPVILTTMDIRRRLRRLIEHDFPGLGVLSYQELSPDMNIQPIARISVD